MTERALLMHGLGTTDDPVFAGMHDAAAMVAGPRWPRRGRSGPSPRSTGSASPAACTMRWPGAPSGSASNNDPAIAIAWLLRPGAERIAYVDVDVHHGDGVQAAFWNDPRVLTISLHEHPDTLFPGTGQPTEIGGPDAPGAAVNVALPAGTRDAGWLRAFGAVVPPLLRAFAPQLLVSQHGCDTHWSDPLASLGLTIDAQRAADAALHALAHEVAGGRWLLTGGGGYEHVNVVPRAWTHLLFKAAGRPLDPAAGTPESWREYVAATTTATAPDTMTEGGQGDFDRRTGFETGYNPADPVDQASLATRKAAFPSNGLTP